ncbi:nuclear transport factor 2 family protein [Massilia sp. P8910]|uniref:YybH family protein n=1 Tax=Massilia antarctica TaxID=2765360 RepID=UPI001E59CF9A|nr:nuclear transport factor 2 family protein [Massilia antarctica]MCE3602832.1 nuclear transport factor 2 family protein [Massilia antarctica]
MQKIAMLLLVGMVCSTAKAASPRETVEAFHAALSKGDKAAAAALLSPELLIYESGYVERSRAEYASHHLDGDIAFARTVSSKVLKQGERAEGRMAVVWQENETTGMANGKPVHLFGTETAVLEKSGDIWTILHVHWSSRKEK